MNRNRKLPNPNPAKQRIVASALLGLILHLLFVLTTHHHPIQLRGADPSVPIISQDSHTPEQHLPQSGDDFHCATCNLQRSLASQHAQPVFVVQLLLPTVCWETIHIEPHLVGAFPSSISRAPPLA